MARKSIGLYQIQYCEDLHTDPSCAQDSRPDPRWPMHRVPLWDVPELLALCTKPACMAPWETLGIIDMLSQVYEGNQHHLAGGSGFVNDRALLFARHDRDGAAAALAAYGTPRPTPTIDHGRVFREWLGRSLGHPQDCPADLTEVVMGHLGEEYVPAYKAAWAAHEEAHVTYRFGRVRPAALMGLAEVTAVHPGWGVQLSAASLLTATGLTPFTPSVRMPLHVALALTTVEELMQYGDVRNPRLTIDPLGPAGQIAAAMGVPMWGGFHNYHAEFCTDPECECFPDEQDEDTFEPDMGTPDLWHIAMAAA